MLKSSFVQENFKTDGRDNLFGVNCDVIRTEDGHYVNSHKGLYGRLKRENCLLSLAEQTAFPCWDSMAAGNNMLILKRQRSKSHAARKSSNPGNIDIEKTLRKHSTPQRKWIEGDNQNIIKPLNLATNKHSNTDLRMKTSRKNSALQPNDIDGKDRITNPKSCTTEHSNTDLRMKTSRKNSTPQQNGFDGTNIITAKVPTSEHLNTDLRIKTLRKNSTPMQNLVNKKEPKVTSDCSNVDEKLRKNSTPQQKFNDLKEKTIKPILGTSEHVDERIKCKAEKEIIHTIENYRNELKSLGTKYINPRRSSDSQMIYIPIKSEDKPFLIEKSNSYVDEFETPNMRNKRKESFEKPIKGNRPSHYKGARKGTYNASYDPHITAQKPRHRSRSKSLFNQNDEKIKMTLTTRLLASAYSANTPDQCNTITKFEKFITKHDVILNEHEENSREGEHYLPTVKNGRTVSITKSKSFSYEISRIPNMAPTKEDTNLFVLPKRRVSRSSEDLINNHSTSFENDSINRTMSSSSGSDTSSRNSWNGIEIIKRSRANSSFESAPEQHLLNLQRKYDRARKRCSKKMRSSQSNDNIKMVETTEVHEAVKSGDVAKLKQLIINGYDINTSDKYCLPPFHYALSEGKDECMTLLLAAGADMKEYFRMRRLKYFR